MSSKTAKTSKKPQVAKPKTKTKTQKTNTKAKPKTKKISKVKKIVVKTPIKPPVQLPSLKGVIPEINNIKVTTTVGPDTNLRPVLSLSSNDTGASKVQGRVVAKAKGSNTPTILGAGLVVAAVVTYLLLYANR